MKVKEGAGYAQYYSFVINSTSRGLDLREALDIVEGARVTQLAALRLSCTKGRRDEIRPRSPVPVPIPVSHARLWAMALSATHRGHRNHFISVDAHVLFLWTLGSVGRIRTRVVITIGKSVILLASEVLRVHEACTAQLSKT